MGAWYARASLWSVNEWCCPKVGRRAEQVACESADCGSEAERHGWQSFVAAHAQRPQASVANFPLGSFWTGNPLSKLSMLDQAGGDLIRLW